MAALLRALFPIYSLMGLSSRSRVALGYPNVNGAAFAMHAFALRELGIEFFHLCEPNMSTAHAELSVRRPTALFGPASLVLRIAAIEDAREKRELDSLEALLCSGMPLSDSGRNFIQQTLHAETFRCAGATEISLLASECHQHNGMHFLNELAYPEFLEAGFSSKHCELIVSSLRNPAFHLFRYRLGDVVVVSQEPCECGAATPRIRIVGRIDDTATTSSGVTIWAPNIQSLVDEIPGLTGGFQLLLHDQRNRLECVAEVWETDEKARVSAAEKLRHSIRTQVLGCGTQLRTAKKDPCLEVRVVRPGNLAHGRVKYRRVILVP